MAERSKALASGRMERLLVSKDAWVRIPLLSTPFFILLRSFMLNGVFCRLEFSARILINVVEDRSTLRAARGWDGAAAGIGACGAAR